MLYQHDCCSRPDHTLTQALRYTPGVISQYGDDSRYDWFTIRGFRPSRYLDGLRLPFGSRGYAQPRVELFSLERAEGHLKGPASVLYGQGDPGGLINMVSNGRAQLLLMKWMKLYQAYRQRSISRRWRW